jgi:hypothetical protein
MCRKRRGGKYDQSKGQKTKRADVIKRGEADVGAVLEECGKKGGGRFQERRRGVAMGGHRGKGRER